MDDPTIYSESPNVCPCCNNVIEDWLTIGGWSGIDDSTGERCHGVVFQAHCEHCDIKLKSYDSSADDDILWGYDEAFQ